MTTSKTQDHIKIRIELRHRGDSGPAGEWLWAQPVDAHDGGGTYRLFNISYFVPLGLGDIVRAELDGDGLLQVVDVVDVVDVADAVWSRFASSPWLSDDEVRAMGDSWVERGAQWSEGSSHVLTTMWPGMSAIDVRRALEGDIRAGRGSVVDIVAPADRTTCHQSGVEFRKGGLTSEPVETTYWIGDDPWWAAHGYTEPDFLAFVQTIAGEEALVARALEAGRHREALRLLGIA